VSCKNADEDVMAVVFVYLLESVLDFGSGAVSKSLYEGSYMVSCTNVCCRRSTVKAVQMCKCQAIFEDSSRVSNTQLTELAE